MELKDFFILGLFEFSFSQYSSPRKVLKYFFASKGLKTCSCSLIVIPRTDCSPDFAIFGLGTCLLAILGLCHLGTWDLPLCHLGTYVSDLDDLLEFILARFVVNFLLFSSVKTPPNPLAGSTGRQTLFWVFEIYVNL